MKLFSFELLFLFLVLFAISADADTEPWPKDQDSGFLKSFPVFKTFSNENKVDRNGRIVGGEVVVPHTHPYQACLLSADAVNTMLCGGSLISARTVLTAGHCIVNRLTSQVILGAHNYRTFEPTQQRINVPAADFRIHPNYHTGYNDIALLLLPSPVTFNEYVQAIALPTEFPNDLFAGELATVSGFGSTGSSGISAFNELRSVTNPIMGNPECARFFFDGIIVPSIICLSTVGGRSSCLGDSGGPMTILRSGKVIQVGISSFVSNFGCEAGVPAGFSRITTHLDWIAENIRE